MRVMHARSRAAALALAAGLPAAMSGCASYRAAPLADAAAGLAGPDAAILSADAARIDRPYLTPQPVDLSAPLTANALAVIAVLANPDLKAQRARSGVSDAQAFAARLLPDPSFQANFDKRVSGPDPFNGFGAQLGFDLTQLRTAGVVRASGNAAKRQVRLDFAWAEWNVAGQARLQAIRVLALERQRDVAARGAESARRLLDATARAAGRGDVAPADLDARRQGDIDAADRLRTAEQELTAARGALARQLGLPPDATIRLAPMPVPPPPPAASVLVAQALTQRLDLQALRAGYDVAEADLHRAVLEQFPNLSLTLAGARDTANNYTAGPSVGFTLPLWNRNRGAIAVATATRGQLRAEYDARLFQTRAEIAAACDAIATLARQRAALDRALPALERYAAATARAAERGDLAPATAATALQAARDRQLTRLQLEQQIAEQTIALELLSGGPSEGWPK